MCLHSLQRFIVASASEKISILCYNARPMKAMTAIMLFVAASCAVSASGATNDPPRDAKITSSSVYYDRKEGFAYFNGNVFVDDPQYKIHADRAYVFMSDTNDVRRIVALGHVAMTNGTKRAYGSKVSFYRNPGKVILSADDGAAAEVRDEEGGADRVVRGKKIVFWTNSRQVEVVEAEISAPTKGLVDDPISRFGK